MRNIINKIRRGAAVAAVAVGVALVAAPAAAHASAPPDVTLEAGDVSTVVIAAPIVTIIISLLIPVINGFLTKAETPAGVKAIGTIVLNAAWALFANGVIADGSAVFSSSTLYTALLGCVISIVSYAGVYKPMNVTNSRHITASGAVLDGKLANVGRK